LAIDIVKNVFEVIYVLNLQDVVLITIYALERRGVIVNHRSLSAYLCALNKTYRIADADYILYPNGAESLAINAMIEVLYLNSYITISCGEIRMTERGKDIVMSLLYREEGERIYIMILNFIRNKTYKDIIMICGGVDAGRGKD